MLAVYLSLVAHQQAIVKFVSNLVCNRHVRAIYQGKLIKYVFNFAYHSHKLIDCGPSGDRVKSTLHQTKKTFFHLLAQLILFLQASQEGNETQSLCPWFKNQAIGEKYQHFEAELLKKVAHVVNYVKYCKKRDILRSDINQINRQHFESQAAASSVAEVVKDKQEADEDDEKEIEIDVGDLGDIVIEPEDTNAPQMRRKLERYIEDVLEQDDFVLLTRGSTQWDSLQNERAILISRLLKLMAMMTEFLSEKQIKDALAHQEFELMAMLQKYKESGEDDFDLFSTLQNRVNIFSEKYDDHHNDFEDSLNADSVDRDD